MTPRSPVADELFAAGYEFDFFQAVRHLELLALDKPPVGRENIAAEAAVRFRPKASLSFAPSAIDEVRRAARIDVPPLGAIYRPPLVTVTFFGMYGPHGALPLHYTERVVQLARETRDKSPFRDWLDLFNHRLTALMYRAWEKYRFPVAFLREQARAAFRRERGEPAARAGRELDPFTRTLYALTGMGLPQVRGRVSITVQPVGPLDETPSPPVVGGRVPDLALLHYAGLFAQKPASAAGLAALLRDYFAMPVEVVPLTGQWLPRPRHSRTVLEDGSHCTLGSDAIAGDCIWDLQSKFRLRIGPLRYADFVDLLPDPTPGTARKRFYLVSQLVRLYVGPEFDFEVQLVLIGRDVPECLLAEAEGGELGPCLGWNTWLADAGGLPADTADATFDGIDEPVVMAG